MPMKAARRFGASLYAGFREYVRRHHKTCAAVVLNPTRFSPSTGLQAEVRRVEQSPGFRLIFGAGCVPAEINSNHGLMACIPIAPRRLSKPRAFALIDRNDQRHEFVGEGFRTPYQTLILIHAVDSLGKLRPVLRAAS